MKTTKKLLILVIAVIFCTSCGMFGLSDSAWSEVFEKYGYKLKKGLEIQTKVINSDKDNRRIILELHRESEFSGNDIMEMLNLKPSRTVGILKKMLSDAVTNGEIDTSYAAGSNFIREKAKDIL